MTNQLIREASHQALCALSEAYRNRRKYSNYYALLQVALG